MCRTMEKVCNYQLDLLISAALDNLRAMEKLNSLYFIFLAHCLRISPVFFPLSATVIMVKFQHE